MRRIITLLLALLIGTACGGKDPALLDADGEQRAGGAGGGLASLGGMTLESADPLPLQAEATWSLPIRVRVLDTASGAPVVGELVQFEITTAPDPDASLSALSTMTSESGEAVIDLRLGRTTGEAIVTARHLDAAPLDVRVAIGEPTTGTIRVDIRDPGNAPVTLPPYRVAFHAQAELDCATYTPRTRQPEPLAEKHSPDRQPVLQSGFPPSQPFTVVVEAMGSGGLALASGCMDGLSVTPGATQLADIQLAMVPVSPSGVYDVESVWDISEAVASMNGATGALVRVIEFMANPGQAIYDIVLEQIEDAVGFNLELLLDIAGINDRAINYINTQFNRSATVATFSAISADLSTMLNELRVSSRLTIAKTDREFNFTGHEEWTAVEVAWTWKCEDRQAAGCESHRVDLTEAGGAAGAISYDWTGRVDDYADLVIDAHAVQIDIGRLQLYLLEQVILPELTNGRATSLAEAAAHWIDCGALAQRALQGQEMCDPTGFFCVGPPEAASVCEDAIEFLAEQVTRPLRDLDATLQMQMNGRATLVDGAGAGIAAQIDDGLTTGTVAGASEPVRVEWSGVSAP